MRRFANPVTMGLQTALPALFGCDQQRMAQLQPAYFAHVQPGMSQDQVRRIIGMPATQQFFKLKLEGLWEWYWLDGQSKMVFLVSFDASGKVLRSATSDDPRETLRR